MIRISLAAVAVAAMCTSVALAGDDDKGPTLSIGDDAPALDISHWVKGNQVEAFEEGKVYVVEFWATWCGPCRMSMPHLSSLQEKYADYDVTIVSVSDEPLATVVDFCPNTDVVELNGRAIVRCAGHCKLELSRQEREFRVQHGPLSHEF